MAALAAATFCALLLVHHDSGRTNEVLIAKLPTAHIPAVVTIREIDRTLRDIERHLQRAGSAGVDHRALAEADVLHERLIQTIAQARDNAAFDARSLDELAAAFDDYYPLLRTGSAQAAVVEARRHEVQDRLEDAARQESRAMEVSVGLIAQNQRRSERLMVVIIALAIGVLVPLAIGLARATRRAFDRMIQSEARAHHLVESVGAVVWRREARTGRFLFVSGDALVLLGYPLERWQEGAGFWSEHVHPDDRDLVDGAIARAVEGEHQELECRVIAASGRTIWLHGLVRLVPGVANADELLGVFQDITDRKQIQQDLEDRDRQLREAQRLAGLGIWEWEIEPDRFTWSDQMSGIFGVSRPPARFEEFLALVHPEDRAGMEAVTARTLHDGGSSGVYHRIIRPDGVIRTLYTLGEVIWEGDQPVRVRGTAQDVTEVQSTAAALKMSEEQLRQSQKMDAIGRLAGGVAHDFNNLLNVIMGYGELLQRRLEKDSALHRHALEIMSAAGRAADLTRQLLAFSRKQVLQPRVLDLNLVVSDMEKMLHRLIGEHITLRTALQPDLGAIKADRGQIEQVILNLVVNARDAMPTGGELTIRTERARVDSDHAAAPGGVKTPHVLLSVSDTGSGIPSATLPHIFEPFFTTKEAGKGTGLGLSTVYGIVNQSGGRIEVQSAIDRGATFKIYLPQAETEAVSAVAPGEEAPPPGTETVLLVEDDDNVRQMARELLVEAGYRVIDSASPAEALQLFSSCTSPTGLVLTDMVMPGMNGRELARRLQAARPSWRVLFMSGYVSDTGGEAMLVESDVHFLAKPFSRRELLHKVREVLDAGTSASSSSLLCNPTA